MKNICQQHVDGVKNRIRLLIEFQKMNYGRLIMHTQCIFNTDDRKTRKLTALNVSIKKMMKEMKENTYLIHIIPEEDIDSIVAASTSVGASIFITNIKRMQM